MTGREERSFGFVEWFPPAERDRVERTLEEIGATPARHLCAHLSWTEFHAPSGVEWYDWLIPTLGARIDLLPCLRHAPPAPSRADDPANARRRLQNYAEFIVLFLTRYGAHFRQIELGGEPGDLRDPQRPDDSRDAFSETIAAITRRARACGFEPVLGGSTPFDAHLLNLMGEKGALNDFSAVGLHGFPGAWEGEAGAGTFWAQQVAAAQAILDRHGSNARLWITEAGFSTWRHDELGQARSFIRALDAPVERVYWRGWLDAASHPPGQEGLQSDERRHLGLVAESGRPKLLARLLTAGGVRTVEAALDLAAPSLRRCVHPIAVIGGAGFVGSNLADSYLSDGLDVMVVDNLSRPGVERNLAWLKERHGDRVHPVIADVRDELSTRQALADAGAVFHLAAQVAVTTSLTDRVEDFEVNARGTLNVLEALRSLHRRVPVVFASTNKVYGGLESLELVEQADRHRPADADIRAHGVSEAWPLSFSTPYGCSKGVADQYVLDHAKTFGFPAAVLRMSCIYGPRQFGTEDQGWVAHFLIRALAGQPITVYGDGKQVRDILYVGDAVGAYRTVLKRIDEVSGQAFNLGGGADNAVSLRLLLDEIARLLGRPPQVAYSGWRAADQLYFVADARKLTRAVGWRAATGWREGLALLHAWLADPEGREAEAREADSQARRVLA